MVAQCTTSDPAVTTPESPSNASTPAAAARTESPSQFGSGEAANARRPTRDHTPIAAPTACTTSTLVNARSALGVCSSVITEDASWMTASAMAAISKGPPSADAMTQRITSHDAVRRGGPRRGARGTPHHQQDRQQGHDAQIAPADRDRHLMHAQPHAGDRAQRAGHVAVGDQQLQQRDRRDDDQRH